MDSHPDPHEKANVSLRQKSDTVIIYEYATSNTEIFRNKTGVLMSTIISEQGIICQKEYP